MSCSVSSEKSSRICVGLASGEPTKHVRNCDPHMADARTSTTLARLNGNDVLVIHGS
jgi:hypothetical protein